MHRLKTCQPFRLIMAVMILGLVGVSDVSAAIIDFQGYYAPANWTEATSGVGSVDPTGAPGSIAITSSNGGTNDPKSTTFSIAMPADGIVAFDWNYVSANGSPSFDPFGYILNAQFTQLTTILGGVNQSGSESIVVSAGAVFAFSASSSDDLGGAATTTLSRFSGPSAVPEPSIVLLLGVGVAIAGVRSRRRTRS